MIVLAVASYIVYQFKPVSLRRFTASKPKQANYILIKVYIRKSVGFQTINSLTSFWVLAITLSWWTSNRKTPTPDMIDERPQSIDTMKRPYYSISRVASHDACFPQELIFFGCEPSKDLFEQTLCYAFQYICLLPIHTTVVQFAGTKVRNSFHITAIYDGLKVHLYEKLTPNALKQHIFEHLSKGNDLWR